MIKNFSASECKLCNQGFIKTELYGDLFTIEEPKVNPITILSKNLTDKHRKLLNQYTGIGFFKVYKHVSEGNTDLEIFLDVSKLFEYEGTLKDYAEGTQQQTKLIKDYDWVSIGRLYELSNGDYDYFKLYPAIVILKSNNHIEIIEDKLLATKSQVKCTIEGELAYSDSFYKDDMDKYNHDKIYLWSRWAFPAIAVFVSILTIWWSIHQTYNLKKDIKQLEKRVLTIEGK